MSTPTGHIGRMMAADVWLREPAHRRAPSIRPRLRCITHARETNCRSKQSPSRVTVLALLALVLCADFAAADEVAPIGTFSAIRQTGEHCSGYSVDLWRTAGAIRGLFRACKGLAGDLPVGLIERSSYDEKSGRLSFAARLTLGNDYIAGQGEVPSRDLFAFDGRLGAAELTGTLKRTDRVHDDNDDVTEQVRLKKQRDKLPSYPSPDAWQRQADEILKVSGPKW